MAQLPREGIAATPRKEHRMPIERPVPPKAILVMEGARFWGISSKPDIRNKP